MNKALNLIVVISAIITGVIGVWSILGTKTTDFDKLGLGVGTSAVYESLGGRRIHCGEVDDATHCVRDAEDVQSNFRLVLLGWSQLHGINQYREGQHGTPFLLNHLLRPSGIDTLTFSQGNANPKEHFLFYTWLSKQMPIDGLIIGAWLQGMREDAIRPSIAAVTNDPDVSEELRRSAAGQRALVLASINSETSLSDSDSDSDADSDMPLYVQSEEFLSSWMSENVPLWAVRSEAAGQISLFFRNLKFSVLQLRNWLLGLEEEKWVWPIPEQRYQENMKYLEAIIGEAKSQGKEVLVYIPPRPVNGRFPFDPQVYQRFKTEVEALVDNYEGYFANLENCVEGPVWGQTRGGDGELVQDFTHFSAEGHKQLAACLSEVVVDAMVRKP